MRGGGKQDGPLLKLFEKALFNQYKQTIANINFETDAAKPISDFLQQSANEALQEFVNGLYASTQGVEIDNPGE